MYNNGSFVNRNRGGQFGNQNARKHGFYSSILDRGQKNALAQAADMAGLTEEINLLRVSLKSVVRSNPDNSRLILQLINSLCKLMRTQKMLGFDQADDLQKVVQNVIENVSAPLGVTSLKRYPSEQENILR
jgi:hypothetical protein